MFSIFKKKQKPFELPPFPEQIHQVGRDTVIWCHSQIGEYLAGPSQPLPNYGLSQDVMIGSYVCGFVQGQFLANKHMHRWSGGDKDVESLGFVMLVPPWIGFVLGDHDRAIAAMEHLPQLGPASWEIGIQQIDQMGGSDGMNHANGAPKQKGGLLRFYLENNID